MDKKSDFFCRDKSSKHLKSTIKIWRNCIEPRETGVNRNRVREQFPSLTTGGNQGFERHYRLHVTWYIEDITRWREDMNFVFSWQEQYLTRSLRSLVRYCSCHENIKFISSSQRVMFFLVYEETNSTKAKGGNRDFIERYDNHKGDIRKIRHSGPG